jgi:hypothetical protein
VKQFRSHPAQPVISISIDRAAPICTIQRNFDLARIPAFGAEYTFWLTGSVQDATSGGLPEYLVHPAVLNALFEEFGCVLVETMEFHKCYHSALVSGPVAKSLYGQLLHRLSVENARMTRAEWDVISYYSYFVFRKIGEPEPMPAQPMPGDPKSSVFHMQNVDTGETMRVTVDDRPKKKPWR